MPSRDGWTGHLPGWVPRVASTLCSPNRHQGRGLGSGHRLRDEKTTKTLFVPRVADCCTRLMKDLRGLIQFGRKRCRTGLGQKGSAPPSPLHPRRRATLSGRHDAASRTRLRLCTTGPSGPHTLETTSGSPFSPSQTTKNTSLIPRLRRSVSTLIQNLAPSPPVPAQSPRMSFSPARVTPIAA
jgi:hypothetical protein